MREELTYETLQGHAAMIENAMDIVKREACALIRALGIAMIDGNDDDMADLRMLYVKSYSLIADVEAMMRNASRVDITLYDSVEREKQEAGQ